MERRVGRRSLLKVDATRLLWVTDLTADLETI